MAIDTRTAERNFNSGGGGGGLENSRWRRWRRGFVREGARGAGGVLGHPPQKSLKCRGSKMVFSTFTMRYFSKGNSTWMRCKMTGTSSAYSMYLILNQKLFSSRKVEVLRPSQLPIPLAPPFLTAGTLKCKIDQNKNQNLSIEKVQNLGNERRYIYKDLRQDSDQRNISYTTYPKKCFTQTYRHLYGEVMLVLTWMSFNTVDGNQQKHLLPSFATKA